MTWEWSLSLGLDSMLVPLLFFVYSSFTQATPCLSLLVSGVLSYLPKESTFFRNVSFILCWVGKNRIQTQFLLLIQSYHLSLLTADMWEFFLYIKQTINTGSRHQLGLPLTQFSSLSTWRWCQIPQVMDLVPTLLASSTLLLTHSTSYQSWQSNLLTSWKNVASLVYFKEWYKGCR